MSRLDQHVDAVRSRFLMQRFFDWAAWIILGAACGLTVAVVGLKVFGVVLGAKLVWLGIVTVGALLAALILAMARCPNRMQTAVQIDERLGLKERFSTALYARGQSDEFARAAVRDAEKTADSVSLHKRFAYQFPKMGWWSMTAVVVLFSADRFIPQMDVLGRDEKRQQQAEMQKQQRQATEAIQKALVEVNSIPQVGAQEKSIVAARKDLEALLNKPMKDPAAASRTAQNALQEADAVRKKIQDTQRIANAAEQAKAFKSLAAEKSEDSTMAAAKTAIAEGDFNKASQKLQTAIDQFTNADAEKQQQIAKDMEQLANQLKKIANDPAMQEKIRQQLQKAGANADQTQRLMEEMQKAAAGDKAAAERVKDMSENLIRKMNGGVLPAPPQLAAFMKQVEQMQGQVNAQQTSEQMSQAAQKMANAMQQQSKNPGKQANGQKQGQKGQQPGQKGQPGQSPQEGQMADAQQAMQDALSQAEAMQQAAEMADAAGKDGGQGDGKGKGQGQWGQNPGGNGQQGRGQGNGPAGWNQGGQGAGARDYKSPAPFNVKKELSPGEKDNSGKVLSGWFVKSDSIKGESREQFKEVVISAQKDATDDVEQERIPVQAQKVVRDYFDSMQRDAK